MRNLKCVSQRVAGPVPLPGGGEEEPEGGAEWLTTCDPETGSIFVARGCHFLRLPASPDAHLSSWDCDCMEALGSPIVGLHYVQDLGAVCVALLDGEVLLYDCLSAEFEEVGCFESGIVGMSWSPDEELFVVVTGAMQMLLLNKNLDVIIETSVNTDEFGENKPVTAGWGKKETQFHGSAGKYSSQMEKMKQQGTQIGLTDKLRERVDNGRVEVSWRGDGEVFVTSSVDPSRNGERVLRVWSRECVLQSTSEVLEGIEQYLSWRPSGNLIATSQRLPHKHNIVFFEKNGLKHGEFSLPFDSKGMFIRHLEWSCDSTVLAVHLEEAFPSSRPKSCVQLWTTKNYHWYLKYEINNWDQSGERIEQETLVNVMWHPEKAGVLYCTSSEGFISRLEFTWTIFSSEAPELNSNGENDLLSSVSVIDGENILTTHLACGSIPPPMCGHTLELGAGSRCLELAYGLGDDGLTFVSAVTSCGVLKVYSFGSKNGFGPGPSPIFKGELDLMAYIRQYYVEGASEPCSVVLGKQLRALVWLSASTFLVVCSKVNSSESDLFECQIGQGNDGAFTVCKCLKTVFPGEVLTMTVLDLEENGLARVAIQDHQGLVWEYSTNNNSQLEPSLVRFCLPSGEELAFPSKCTSVAFVKMGTGVSCETVAVGLSERYKLYFNTREVVSDCSSIAVTSKYLILSTLSHVCRFVRLDITNPYTVALHQSVPLASDESFRRVERGSLIVSAVPANAQLVLQMPRGNIETISPRALVLSVCETYIDQGRYLEAFVIMRKHRINMNLLYDHDPSSFLKNISAFVEQVGNISHLNIFILELQNVDVTETMYLNMGLKVHKLKKDIDEPSVGPNANKVDLICDALIATMTALDKSKYFLSILTALTMYSQPALSEALEKIRERKADKTPESMAASEDALRYMIYLVKVDTLYNAALGMYDFDLVIMVAEKSHKDPKEYMPFLNSLKQMETHYQRFSIDKYLKKYKKALENLSLAGESYFGELLEFVKAHSLYTDAISLYYDVGDKVKAVYKLYGDYLVAKKYYKDAGHTYVNAGEYSSAMDAFKRALEWEYMFHCASKLSLNEAEYASLATGMAESLCEKQRFLDASTVYEYFVEDAEEAIVTCLKGKHWKECLRKCNVHKRMDIIETHLIPQAITSAEDQSSLLLDTVERFKKHSLRLQVVRDEKLKRTLMFEDDEILDDPDADLFSDTSSVMTGRSGRSSTRSSHASRMSKKSHSSIQTFKTKKSKKKMERRMHSLKEGSPFEEEALLEALKGIVEMAQKIVPDISPLVEVLVFFGKRKPADELQKNMQSLLDTIQSRMATIWPPQPVEQTLPASGPHATANSLAEAYRSQSGSLRSLESSAISDSRTVVPPSPKAPLFKVDDSWKMQKLV
eukprot:Nk52_evm7s244 gene=Nk52_evmTU7s244